MSTAGTPEHRQMVVDNLVALAEGFKASMDGALEIYPDISEEVYRVLQDRALARHPELREGINQMLAGLAKRARTRAERMESAGEAPESD